MEITGEIRYQDIATGTWSLIAEDGQTYELMSPPPEITEDGMKVKITGVVRDDIMTMAMIGPVIEINQCEII